MSADVVDLPVVTTLPTTPQRALRMATEAKLTEVVVIGLDEKGEFYFGGNITDGPQILWHLEIAKRRLLAMMDDNPRGS